MFLFEGIESLMGGHHGGGFLGGGGGQPTVIENITENNNYYDDNIDRSLDHNDRDFASTDDFNDSTDGGFDDSDWS